MELERQSQFKAAIEAMLFAYGEPLTIKKIASFLSLSEAQVNQLLDQLETELNHNQERGVCLLRDLDRVQLGTKPEHYSILTQLLKHDFQAELTPAALEVLTIILYRGPISRAEIDFIRGVNSAYTLRMLLLRGLIERQSNPENRLAFLYQPSFELLRFLGITNVKELPDYQQLNQRLAELVIKEQEKQLNETN